MNYINVKKIHPLATLPTRGNPDDAGLDLYASAQVGYKPGELVLVPTGIAIDIPKGYVGLIRDRSSVSTQLRLKVTAGVIDSGYTGEVQVALLNLSGNHGCITLGRKIAQILIVPVALPQVQEVMEIASHARGDKGFGSTGD